MNIDNYTPVNLEEVLQNLKQNFFPQALRYTDNEDHNLIVDTLLTYFYTPLAKYIDYLQNTLGLTVLDRDTIDILKENIEELSFPGEDLIEIFKTMGNTAYNPNLIDAEYWDEKPIYLFQSLLSKLSPEDYTFEPTKIESWIIEYLKDGDSMTIEEEVSCEELAEFLGRIYYEDFELGIAVNQEFVTSSNEDDKKYRYNLVIGWDDFFPPVFTEEPETTTEGVYDEIR